MQNLHNILLSFILLLAFFTVPSIAQAAQIAYVLANKPTTAVYTPHKYNFYNKGQTVEVTRVTRGVYQIALGRVAGIGATVHTEINGSQPGYCNVWSWYNNTVNVRCFDHDGTPADRRYTLFSVKGESVDAGHLAYAWLNNPMASSYIATSYYAFGSADRRVTRYGTGSYKIHLTHNSVSRLFATGTGYQTDARCRHTTVGTGHYVGLSCQRPSEPDIDVRATVLMLYQGFGRFSYAANVSMKGELYSGSLASDDSPQSVTRLSTGRYRVRIGPEADRGGIVMVTSLLSFANCRAESWKKGVVTVLCLNGTTPEDAGFNLAAISRN